MAEPTSQPTSLIAREPLHFSRTTEGLRDLAETPWSGKDVVISSSEFRRFRDAAAYVLEALRSGDLALTGPLREDLETAGQDNTYSLSRIEQLQAELTEKEKSLAEQQEEHEKREIKKDEAIKALRSGFILLDGAIDAALDNMEGDLELFGSTTITSPFDEIESILRDASNSAANKVASFLDGIIE